MSCLPASDEGSRGDGRCGTSDRAVTPALSELALITGGSRGIGASIARELAGVGWRVAVTGRTREQLARGGRERDRRPRARWRRVAT